MIGYIIKAEMKKMKNNTKQSNKIKRIYPIPSVLAECVFRFGLIVPHQGHELRTHISK